MTLYAANLSYANSRHPYAFPRIVGMLGDGKKEYDQANDGEANAIGACSVGFRFSAFLLF
jgi:lectin, mannose-binding 2